MSRKRTQSEAHIEEPQGLFLLNDVPRKPIAQIVDREKRRTFYNAFSKEEEIQI